MCDVYTGPPHLNCCCFPQIASFSVSPNYDIVFFSSEVYRVVNILDFFSANVELNKVIEDLEAFKIGSESTSSTR